jgi:hypothetical protein
LGQGRLCFGVMGLLAGYFEAEKFLDTGRKRGSERKRPSGTLIGSAAAIEAP